MEIVLIIIGIVLVCIVCKVAHNLVYTPRCAACGARLTLLGEGMAEWQKYKLYICHCGAKFTKWI